MREAQRSWDLKVQRAERHLDEVKAAMVAYASRNSYRAVRVRQPKGQRHVWLYRLEMTEEPDPMIPVIIGERLYNLRSALDHLAVAVAPRKRKANAAFPVKTTDPWAKDAAGNFVYPRRASAELHLQDQGHARRGCRDDHEGSVLPARGFRAVDRQPHQPPGERRQAPDAHSDRPRRHERPERVHGRRRKLSRKALRATCIRRPPPPRSAQGRTGRPFLPPQDLLAGDRERCPSRAWALSLPSPRA